MITSLALGAIAAGLSAGAGIASTAGRYIDIQNAPDNKRFSGNIFSAILNGTDVVTEVTSQVEDIDRVALTYEHTGYRVDETNQCYRKPIIDFINDYANRYYFLPIQFSCDFGYNVNVSSSVPADMQTRAQNGLRFHFVDNTNIDIGEDLQYDNVETSYLEE